MSVRIKTEDGDMIVSGKGKDGKDGKDGGGEIVWFLYDDKHALTWNKRADGIYMTAGTYFDSTFYLLYNMEVKSGSISFDCRKPTSSTSSNVVITKDNYSTSSSYGAVVGIPKFLVEACNIRQVTNE